VMLGNRIIVVGERIGDDTVMRVTATLLALEAADPKREIRMYINSQGASTYSAVALVDIMKSISCPISTIAFGQVNGTSALLLAAGTKGRRFMMPNARVMINQPFGVVAGSSEEVKITATELSRSMKVVNRFFAEFTGRSEEEIEEATDRDNYMGPAEAADFGLVDGMISSEKFPENGTPAPFKGKSIKEIAKLTNRDAVTGTGLGTTA